MDQCNRDVDLCVFLSASIPPVHRWYLFWHITITLQSTDFTSSRLRVCTRSSFVSFRLCSIHAGEQHFCFSVCLSPYLCCQHEVHFSPYFLFYFLPCRNTEWIIVFIISRSQRRLYSNISVASFFHTFLILSLRTLYLPAPLTIFVIVSLLLPLKVKVVPTWSIQWITLGAVTSMKRGAVIWQLLRTINKTLQKPWCLCVVWLKSLYTGLVAQEEVTDQVADVFALSPVLWYLNVFWMVFHLLQYYSKSTFRGRLLDYLLFGQLFCPLHGLSECVTYSMASVSLLIPLLISLQYFTNVHIRYNKP